MARKPENVFLSRIRKKFPEEWDIIKMANPYSAGIADWYVDSPYGDAWIEGKWEPVGKETLYLTNLGAKPNLSKLQQRFLTTRYNNGRCVGVLIGSPKGALFLPGLTWQQEFTTAWELDEVVLQTIQRYITACSASKKRKY